MIIDSFYLSDRGNFDRFIELSELAEDEILKIVGIFRKDHWRFAGKPKGEVVIHASGKIVVRHHFTKKKLWENE